MSGKPEGNGWRRLRLSAVVLLASASIAIQGCTVVRIENSDGSTTVSRHVGVVAIQPGEANTLIRVTSFGFHTAAGNTVLGFGRTELATLVPGTCELILWNSSPETATTFRQLLGSDVSICTHNTLQARDRGSP